MTGKIFLNYRRADSDAWADRLFERLTRHFLRENVFMDIDGNIPFGFPWAQWLDKQVGDCDLMLVLIGRRWVAEFKARAEPAGRDFVRVEIESALARKIPVVPVLLGDASMPSRADLPNSVQPLLDLHAARLRRLSFENDAELLVAGLVRSISLSRGGASVVSRPAPAPVPRKTPDATAPGVPGHAPAPVNEARLLSEGRVRVAAAIVHAAPHQAGVGWLKPEAGNSEWFQDLAGGPEMVIVPAGSFAMGSSRAEIAVLKMDYRSDWYDSEGPQRVVTLAKPFAIARHAVTRGQFAAFVADAGYKLQGGAHVWNGKGWEFSKTASWRAPGFPQDDSHPVVCVSWKDAKAYVAWLDSRSGKKGYRLPSEAEWEYAARAGTSTPFWWGSAISPSQANYNGNFSLSDGSKGEYRQCTVPVGSFQPNGWGLYNVLGNVSEWVEDHWIGGYVDAPTDGTARATADGVDRVQRGGAWSVFPQFLRCAARLRNASGNRDDHVGFRVARDIA